MFLPIGDNIQQRSFPIVASLLIIINVAVFLGHMNMVYQADPKDAEEVAMDFIYTFGLNPVDLAEGKVIGVLTHMFLHGGFMHLLGNMICFWAFACSLEICLGSVYFLAFYVMWGVAAGLAECAASWGVDVPLVGASGAIAGCIGAYTVMFGPMSKIRCLVFIGIHPLTFFMPATAFGLIWIGGQLWDASSDPDGMAGIAWFAHIGGFFAGAITAYFYRNSTDQYLIKDRTGTVAFERRVTEEEIEEMEAERQRALEGPFNCPYCGKELPQESFISPGLAKCTAPTCDRLVYINELIPNA